MQGHFERFEDSWKCISLPLLKAEMIISALLKSLQLLTFQYREKRSPVLCQLTYSPKQSKLPTFQF